MCNTQLKSSNSAFCDSCDTHFLDHTLFLQPGVPASIFQASKFRQTTVVEGKPNGKREAKEVIVIEAIASGSNQSDYIDIE